jgi:GT2 family glycosyltransferase
MNSEIPIPQLQVIQDHRKVLSIVIVVWNGKKYVLGCLESLEQYAPQVDFEVIIVDNASTDGTPQLIEQRFPEFKLIRNSENLGFAKANNIGIQQATGDYICLVNSDVEFTSDCFTPMLSYLDQHPEVAMLGPKWLTASGEIKNSTMRFPTPWNQFCRSLGLDIAFKGSRLFAGLLMSDFDHRSTRPVEVLTGWFVLVRRSALQRVGLLDEHFFMYGEDLDWCYRFHLAAQPVVFFADAEAIHYGGGSSSNAPLRFYLEQVYADCQYWRKHHGRLGEMSFLANVALYHFVRLAGSVLRYVFIPSRRSESANKISRSLTCLRWVNHPTRRPLQMVRPPDAGLIRQPEIAAHGSAD